MRNEPGYAPLDGCPGGGNAELAKHVNGEPGGVGVRATVLSLPRAQIGESETSVLLLRREHSLEKSLLLLGRNQTRVARLRPQEPEATMEVDGGGMGTKVSRETLSAPKGKPIPGGNSGLG